MTSGLPSAKILSIWSSYRTPGLRTDAGSGFRIPCGDPAGTGVGALGIVHLHGDIARHNLGVGIPVEPSILAVPLGRGDVSRVGGLYGRTGGWCRRRTGSRCANDAGTGADREGHKNGGVLHFWKRVNGWENETIR